MLDFLFTKRDKETTSTDKDLNRIYEILKQAYPFDAIPEIRKKYLEMHIQKYGYLTYSYN